MSNNDTDKTLNEPEIHRNLRCLVEDSDVPADVLRNPEGQSCLCVDKETATKYGLTTIDKTWRDKVLRFYGIEGAFFVTYWGEVRHRDFEPCVLGTIVRVENGLLHFRTDWGDWFVPVRDEKHARSLTKPSRIRSNGESPVFGKFFRKSLNRHGYDPSLGSPLVATERSEAA